ncbi:FAD dependent oxidoreductase-domain-containing protein [Cantharellus anzutake]|uniref:FAD dependent oxidoreductase-domain-containing protein n=1 Tax=Cantharellus anzutake TaxID=1750568 RepID=UPI0019058CE6|nr:FAD dependent oxidoreductase-domain-containing protein [Cantharellus anzutake]KAF8325185.1 FAD dependent oxidoreductase-domain-containing protein [Cantharellus anzutake]
MADLDPIGSVQPPSMSIQAPLLSPPLTHTSSFHGLHNFSILGSEPLNWEQPSTASYWSAHNRGAWNTLLGHGRNDPIPTSVETIIIGAGVSGAGIAHFLLHNENFGGSIAMFEAREVSSGATGRNGGFVKPVPFEAYPRYKEKYGTDRALQLVKSEYDNMKLTEQLVELGAIDAHFVIRPHHEILTDEDTVRSHNSAYASLRRDRHLKGMEQIDGVTWFHDSEEARRVTHSKNALAAYSFDTGTIWPHRFVHGLLSNLQSSSLSNRFNLYTHTPVLCISWMKDQIANSRWHVQTTRGNITARNVILATNGYTRHLLQSSCGMPPPPSSINGWLQVLSRAVTPKRYQMAAYTIPESLLSSWRFNFTFGVRGPLSNGSTDKEGGYGITTYDGTLVAGSELAQIASIVEDGPDPWMNQTDDSIVLQPSTKFYQDFPGRVFENWESESEGIGEGLVRTWTGIQGRTRDSLPFVGPLPGKGNNGLFVSIGFHGHGMCRTLIAARGLVHQMLSPNLEWDVRLPRPFEVTEERLQS